MRRGLRLVNTRLPTRSTCIVERIMQKSPHPNERDTDCAFPRDHNQPKETRPAPALDAPQVCIIDLPRASELVVMRLRVVFHDDVALLF